MARKKGKRRLAGEITGTDLQTAIRLGKKNCERTYADDNKVKINACFDGVIQGAQALDWVHRGKGRS